MSSGGDANFQQMLNAAKVSTDKGAPAKTLEEVITGAFDRALGGVARGDGPQLCCLTQRMQRFAVILEHDGARAWVVGLHFRLTQNRTHRSMFLFF